MPLGGPIVSNETAFSLFGNQVLEWPNREGRKGIDTAALSVATV